MQGLRMTWGKQKREEARKESHPLPCLSDTPLSLNLTRLLARVHFGRQRANLPWESKIQEGEKGLTFELAQD